MSAQSTGPDLGIEQRRSAASSQPRPVGFVAEEGQRLLPGPHLVTAVLLFTTYSRRRSGGPTTTRQPGTGHPQGQAWPHFHRRAVRRPPTSANTVPMRPCVVIVQRRS